MFNYKIRTIFKKEFRNLAYNKSFVTSSVMLILITIVLGGMIHLLLMTPVVTPRQIIFFSDSQLILNSLPGLISPEEWLKKYNYRVSFNNSTEKEFKIWLDTNRRSIINRKVEAAVFIPSTALSDKKFSLISKRRVDKELLQSIRASMNKLFSRNYFRDRDILKSDLEFSERVVRIEQEMVSSRQNLTSSEDFILAWLSAFMNVICIIIVGSVMMYGILEDKSNRPFENVLSSVSARETLLGRIYAMSLGGLILMSICLLPLFFLLLQQKCNSTSPLFFPYLGISYLAGSITALSFFAAAGSLFNEIHKGRRAMGMIALFTGFPIFVIFSVLHNPSGGLQVILSIIPFSSLIVMSARLTTGDVPLWQLFFSIMGNLVMMAVVFTLSVRVYKRGIFYDKEVDFYKIREWLSRTD